MTQIDHDNFSNLSLWLYDLRLTYSLLYLSTVAMFPAHENIHLWLINTTISFILQKHSWVYKCQETLTKRENISTLFSSLVNISLTFLKNEYTENIPFFVIILTAFYKLHAYRDKRHTT